MPAGRSEAVRKKKPARRRCTLIKGIHRVERYRHGTDRRDTEDPIACVGEPGLSSTSPSRSVTVNYPLISRPLIASDRAWPRTSRRTRSRLYLLLFVIGHRCDDLVFSFFDEVWSRNHSGKEIRFEDLFNFGNSVVDWVNFIFLKYIQSVKCL